MFTVSEASVHYDRGDMTEQSSLHHEARRRERERANEFSPFHPFMTSRPPACGIETFTFRVGLLPLVNPVWKHSHRHTQRYALLIS
jgi:hypothetical protein